MNRIDTLFTGLGLLWVAVFALVVAQNAAPRRISDATAPAVDRGGVVEEALGQAPRRVARRERRLRVPVFSPGALLVGP